MTEAERKEKYLYEKEKARLLLSLPVKEWHKRYPGNIDVDWWLIVDYEADHQIELSKKP